jgi:hypothetical protein
MSHYQDRKMDPLQTYIVNVVKLGQEALALYRRGYTLPDELSGPAQELLALEKELSLAPTPRAASGASAGMTAGVPSKVEDILVLDVEEEAGGGPSVIGSPSDALPPLVVDLFEEEVAPVQREMLTPPAQNLGGRSVVSTGAADGSGICRRCGEPLRPNSHYCHRCGQRHDRPL